jgi:hypothetical protein
MGPMNMDKTILNASLDKLVRREDIEETVADINEILEKYSNHSDEIALYQRERVDNRLLREAQALLPLEGVGHYRGSSRKIENGRIITYKKPEAAVEIHFRKKKAVFADLNVEELVEVAEIVKNEEDVQQMILAAADSRHYKEGVLGDEAKTLDNYFLERVDILTPAPLRFKLGIPPWTNQDRKTVYTKPL